MKKEPIKIKIVCLMRALAGDMRADGRRSSAVVEELDPSQVLLRRAGSADGESG